jgi:YVTN family beta-propeller protein
MNAIASTVLTALALTQATAVAAATPEAQHDAQIRDHQVANYEVDKRFNLGGAGGWDYLTVDASKHRLFISRSDHVMVVDTLNGKTLGTIADTQGVHAIVLVPALSRGFTSNGRANSITEFDLASLKTVRTIPAGGENPDALLYDAHSSHLFAFNGRSQNVTVIDPVAGTVIATIPAGGKPEFAASDGAGNVFVNIEDTAQLKRIDSRSNEVTATWKLDDCEEPTGLALDALHHRLFSVCQNGKMAVTDAMSGKHVASVAIGKGPDAAAFDAARGLVFSSNGQDGTLTIVHQDTADNYSVLANITTQKSARTMALDSSNHHIYLVAAEFGPAPAASAEQPHPRPPVVEGSFTVLVVGEK